MEERCIHVLRFSDRDALSRAFELISEAADVESLSLESEEVRIRYVAKRTIGRKLAQRVEARGGLVFASAHVLRGEPGEWSR